MSFVNWMIDTQAGEDVIDLYFIMSDLVEINLTDSEMYENAVLDSLASNTVRERSRENHVPVGKQVF